MNTFYEQQISKELGEFTSHSLNDLSNAKLMDRIDTKYLTTISGLLQLLPKLKEHCTILEIDNRRISRYETLYFDDKDLGFYHAHHNAKLNRYKVRKRTYAEQASSFLEVKFKNNKARTIKTRIPSKQQAISQEEKKFISEMGVRVTNLTKSQDCNYIRIALANEKTAERLTIDYQLSFKDYFNNKEVNLGDAVILELKQEKLNRNSTLYQVIRRHKLRPCSFSKYCVGTGLLNKGKIKLNRFKKSILQLEKISGVSQC